MTDSGIEKIKLLLSNEVGTIYKPHTDKLKVALAFPNIYNVGMSSLGFQTIYRILNNRDDTVCERVFLPDDHTEESASLVTMESQTSVRNFDLLAFSLSFEMDYPNIIRMMNLAGIEPSAKIRKNLKNQPIVIAGGPAVTFNPEPLADFFDTIVIGEAEGVLDEIVDVLHRDGSGDHDQILMELAKIDGVYVPSFYTPHYTDDGTISHMEVREGIPASVDRRWTRRNPPASTVILTPATEFSDMILVEVARGCGRMCRFCAAGFTYLPARPSDPNAILDAIHAYPDGNRRVGLMSASVFDHESSSTICHALIEEGISFSISSTRADTLNSDTAGLLMQGGHKTLTIAPEAGSERMRKVINKTINHDDILNAAKSAWDSGFRRLKLYFMIGLPTETDADIQAVIDLTAEVVNLYKWRKVSVSVSCFVPKPGTPFQWAAMESEKSLSRKLSVIKKQLRLLKSVDFHNESPRQALIQGVLSRG
ncbi:MAG: radical SAM protein, partial [Armatimonadota bacterium]